MNCGCKCKSEKVKEMHSVHKRGEMGNMLPAVKLFSLAKNKYMFFRFKHHFELLPKFNFQTESETVGPDI